jgi:hypothetical protein
MGSRTRLLHRVLRAPDGTAAKEKGSSSTVAVAVAVADHADGHHTYRVDITRK